MPRHQPLDRPAPEQVLDGMKVTMRRGADGALTVVAPPKDATATTEARPQPREQPDPRPAAQRNIPPYGAV